MLVLAPVDVRIFFLLRQNLVIFIIIIITVQLEILVDKNFGECPRFCVWRLIFWRPAPGSRIAVIEKQILATNILADA